MAVKRCMSGTNSSQLAPMTSRYVSFPTRILVSPNLSQARLACTTAWIASPEETVQLLDELAAHTTAEELIRKDETLKVLRASA